MGERAQLIAAIEATQADMTALLTHDQSRIILDSPLTMSQLKMLMLLRIHGPVGGHALATTLQVSMPSVSGMVDRLEARGLVVRREDPADRRVRLIALSEQGTAMIAEHEAAGREVSAEILADLDVEELRALVRGLRAIRRAAARRADRRGLVVTSAEVCAGRRDEDVVAGP